MPQITVQVASNGTVTVKMSFKGVARYAAALYLPVAGAHDQWTLMKSLEDDGSSADARPDEFAFDPPAAGTSVLFFFEARMTSSTAPPADVGATAEFIQGGQSKGTAPESGQTTGVPSQVVVRALLQA